MSSVSERVRTGGRWLVGNLSDTEGIDFGPYSRAF
jgi:hypothetical protein